MHNHQRPYFSATQLIMEGNMKKTIDIAEVKTSIIDSVLGYKRGSHPKTYKILSLGCSIVALGLAQRGHDVSAINCPTGYREWAETVYKESKVLREWVSEVEDESKDLGLFTNFQEGTEEDDWSLADEIDAGNTYDIVLGLDQTLTWFDTEDEQREFINQVAKVTKGTFITSLIDYKNQTSQSRMADLPLTININGKQNLFINHRTWNPMDRQRYENNWLHIEEDVLIGTSKSKRRTMFFKQLAKFSSDAGSTGFRIHKNLFYKPLINKTFEHVISIDYE